MDSFDSPGLEDEHEVRRLLWFLKKAEELGSAELAEDVARQADALDLDEVPAGDLVELAVTMAHSRLIPADRADRFCEEVGAFLLAGTNDASARGLWYTAHAGYTLYRELPQGRFQPPPDELVQCALDELRELATEFRFEEHRLTEVEELLSFLVENCAEGELAEEFEKVEQVLRESRESSEAEDGLFPD